MLQTLYRALKANEFDASGRCTCCIGDKWHGHAGYCEVGQAIDRYEARGEGAMICRKCPRCGGEWYSAATGSWECEYCGTELDRRHEKPIERRGEGERDLSESLRIVRPNGQGGYLQKVRAAVSKVAEKNSG